MKKGSIEHGFFDFRFATMSYSHQIQSVCEQRVHGLCILLSLRIEYPVPQQALNDGVGNSSRLVLSN